MFRTVRLSALLVALALAAQSAAAQSALPGVLTQAVAATQAAKVDYAFDLEIDARETNWRARYDPARQPALRLVQPARDTLDNGQRRAFDRMAEDMDGLAWCASENMGRVENVRLVREDESVAIYSFQPTPESIRGEQARRFADRLRGEFTISKTAPDISRIRIFAPEAFSPLPLVRVDRINISIACRAAPNGRLYAAEMISEVRGSAFGQSFDERSVQRARNLSGPS